MGDGKLGRIAELLAGRNAIDEEISAITPRPMTAGHLGEWIASRVFDTEVEESAANTAFDGRYGSDRFRAGCIREVYLFDAERLRDEQDVRGVKTGVASSVLRRQWDDAEIYPHDRNPLLRVTPHQVELLQLLSADLRPNVRCAGQSASLRCIAG